MILNMISSYKKQVELLEIILSYKQQVELLEKKVQLETESKVLWKQEALYYRQKLEQSLNLLDRSTTYIEKHKLL